MSNKKKHIDDIIKDNFDLDSEDFDFGSWDNLEEKMDRDNTIDKTVVSAFDIPKEEIPSSVWSNVNDQLDIDTVWDRIDDSLYKRRRKAIWWWNAASVAFMAVFLFLLLDDSYETREDRKYVQDAVQVNIDSITEVRDKHIISSRKDVINKNAGVINSRQSILKSNDIGDHSSNAVNTSQPADSRKTKTSSALNSVDKDSTRTALKGGDNGTDYFAFSPVNVLPIRFKNNLRFELNDSPDSLALTESTVHHPPQKHWNIGITSGILSTNLMDALFRESVSSNSLVTPEFSLAINPGVFAQYRTDNNWLIQADLYLNYKIVRRVSLYEELSYVTRKTELNYQRLHLYGGKRFLLTNSTRSRTFFEASMGGFVSYLSNQLEYRGNTIISKTKTLSDWNIGLDADIGIVHSFDRVSIAYGAQINKGLLNVMKDVSSKSYNRASTLSTGLYLRLGYQF